MCAPRSRMRRADRRMLGVGMLGAVLATGCSPAPRSGDPRPGAPRPLTRAWWYWHHPFQLSAGEGETLRRTGVSGLFVHAGTLTARKGALAWTAGQVWKSVPPCALHAVIRVETEALPLLLGPEGATQAAALVRPALPGAASGIQWDADVPTDRLADYVRFLQGIRAALRGPHSLSVTALPDWLRSPAYGSLCGVVDEVAMQFYGNELPKPRSQPPPLWETRDLLRRVQNGVQGQARLVVGLPAYGRVLVLNREGRLRGLRHDVAPESLLDDPRWEELLAETRTGKFTPLSPPFPLEDTFALRAAAETELGPVTVEPGTVAVFQWPRAAGVRNLVRLLQDLPGPRPAGVCFFRWPAAGEPLALPGAPELFAGSAEGMPTGGSALPTVRENTEAVDLHVRFEVLPGQGGARVVVENQGPDSPLLGDGLTLEVQPSGGQVRASDAGGGRRGGQSVSPLRADHFLLRRPLLRNTARWEACEVTGARGPITATLRWRGADGGRESRSFSHPGRGS